MEQVFEFFQENTGIELASFGIRAELDAFVRKWKHSKKAMFVAFVAGFHLSNRGCLGLSLASRCEKWRLLSRTSRTSSKRQPRSTFTRWMVSISLHRKFLYKVVWKWEMSSKKWSGSFCFLWFCWGLDVLIFVDFVIQSFKPEECLWLYVYIAFSLWDICSNWELNW